jgi:WD40 repeat protein
MKKVIISKFHNGVSDTETNSTTYNKDLGNFDIYEDINKLIPTPTLTEATIGGGSAKVVSNFFKATITGVGEKTYAFGKFSDSDTRATLYAMDAEGAFNKKVNLTTSIIEESNNYCLYGGIPHLITQGASTTYYLNSFTSEATATQIATISATTNGKPQIFNNPIDGRLYIAIGKQVFVWNGTTMVTGLTLPNEITSICGYSSYLAIANTNGKENYVSIWNRDTSLETVTQVLDFGTGRLEILENINGMLFGVSYENDILTIRYWSGGEVQIFKSFEIKSDNGSTNLLNIKKKVENKLYFATRNTNSL